MSTTKLVLGLFINIVAAVSIIIANKYIFKNEKFPKLTLACFHLLVMAVLLEVSLRLNVFEFKRLPVMKLLPLSISFSGSLAMANYSLQQNSVTGFQVFKALVMPFILGIQSLAFNKTISAKMKFTLVSVIVMLHLRLELAHQDR